MNRTLVITLLLSLGLTACSSLPFSIPRDSAGEPPAPALSLATQAPESLGLSAGEAPAATGLPGEGFAVLPTNTPFVVTATIAINSTSAAAALANSTPEPTMVVTLPEVAAAALTPAGAPLQAQPSEALFNAPVYGLQLGTPAGVANFLHPDLGCNWTGVGGQVFDKDGNALTGLIVEVSGSLDGKEVLSLALTGSAPAFGAGGYEITLGNHPVASQGTLWTQLYDIGGKPLTDRMSFDTYGGCDQNLVLINFSQARSPSIFFFPNIFQNAIIQR